ncbi:MAG: basic amino acid/polyamine antiporter, family [Blastocatellia bacterium]|jgi:APA family basic amino acid/polyamine antiporter|nr:basic amino acid/polyamine antiporter, family [Blastocatellia bacterium]
MIVMGGIIGAGIFTNPYVVAQQVHTPLLILGAWAVGGLIALAGAFIYAELSSQSSESGGQYVYLRDALHPLVAFGYGWSLLFVIQTGGMAAVALIFANHVFELVGVQVTDLRAALLGSAALALLTIINCIGVRAGSVTQNIFMVLKLIAIAALVAFGLMVSGPAQGAAVTNSAGSSVTIWQSLIAFGAALIPAQFAYGGWQTACFVAGEVREPRRNLPRGLLFGVLGVIVVYLSVNYVCVHALGAQGLAQTKTPASAVMRLALGERGGRFLAAGIAISTIGFLSQSMLTAPRVYFAMAEDGLFFKQLAWLNRARVPAVAIALQGVLAIVIALVASRFEQILNYVVSVDVVFFALTAVCVFVFRARTRGKAKADFFRIPGHPFTTLFFIAACCVITFSVVYKEPMNTAISLGIMLAGLPAYFIWAWLRRRREGKLPNLPI